MPEEQRSKAGMYLMPKQTPALIKSKKGKVLFVDVRTRAEAQFLGMATPVDALVPYVEFQDFMTDWDETKGLLQARAVQRLCSRSSDAVCRRRV